MRNNFKNAALVFCLFTFLLIVLGAGLRLNPGGALLAAATGTPLLIHLFHRSARVRELTRPDAIEVPSDSERVAAKHLRAAQS
jgi:Flp pilus assembly protein TadB